MDDDTSIARRVALRAAGASALFSIAYVVAQICEWLGLLGSAGGPDAASTPLGLALLLTPSLLAFQMYWPLLIWGGALWALTFPAAMILLVLMLRPAMSTSQKFCAATESGSDCRPPQIC